LAGIKKASIKFTTSDFRVGVFLQASIQNSVGNLVAKFIFLISFSNTKIPGCPSETDSEVNKKVSIADMECFFDTRLRCVENNSDSKFEEIPHKKKNLASIMEKHNRGWDFSCPQKAVEVASPFEERT
jgi:hypothetical protein